MLRDFGLVGILLILSIVVPAGMLVFSWFLSKVRIRPFKPAPMKYDTYECGVQSLGGSWVQYNFRYYYYALLFVLFDVETVFLYPWAVYFNKLGLFGFVEMMVFLLILVVGFVYAWKKQALEWT